MAQGGKSFSDEMLKGGRNENAPLLQKVETGGRNAKIRCGRKKKQRKKAVRRMKR